MATRDVTAPTALTLKTVLRDYSTGTERLWNTSGTPGFEAYNSAHIADYGITTAEGSPGSYKWTVPATLASLATGEYKSKTYRIAASSLATGDLANIVYEDEFPWDGTNFSTPTTGGAPSAATVAAQVRVELTTELGRIDAAVTSRLASGSYTAPDNSSITAIKSKTDNLPDDPAGISDLPEAGDSIDYALISAAAAGGVKLVAPQVVERPVTGTTSYTFDVEVRSSAGALIDADTNPTIKLRDPDDNNLATSWALSAPTKRSTGIYTYTVAVPSTYADSSAYLSTTALVSTVPFSDTQMIAVSSSAEAADTEGLAEAVAAAILEDTTNKLRTLVNGEVVPRAVNVTQIA